MSELTDEQLAQLPRWRRDLVLARRARRTARAKIAERQVATPPPAPGPLRRAVAAVLAPGDTINARLAICAQCPHRKTRGPVAYCGKCGCPLQSKTRMARASCPDGRWGAV
ncbi:MAG TPA: hypothetical protein VFG73_02320 [Rhodanobacteraceae bacterium]|nr:hypothetical protein [Rhodanobacteraceae bacterium]